MGETDVDAVRELLLADRQASLREIDDVGRDLSSVVEAATDVATDDEHDPEGATIAFERARVGALLDQTRQHVADIDRALDRIAAPGTAPGSAVPTGPSGPSTRPSPFGSA